MGMGIVYAGADFRKIISLVLVTATTPYNCNWRLGIHLPPAGARAATAGQPVVARLDPRASTGATVRQLPIRAPQHSFCCRTWIEIIELKQHGSSFHGESKLNLESLDTRCK